GVRLAFAVADDANGFVEGVEDNAKALQNVNASPQLFQLVFKSATDRVETEVEEAAEHLLEAQPVGLRLNIRTRHQAGHVVSEAFLQRGVLVKVGHDDLRIAASLQLQDYAHAFFFIGFIDHAGELRQFLGLDQLTDGRLQVALVDAIRDTGDHDLLATAHNFQLPLALDLDAARAVFINLAQAAAVGQHLPTQGKIRAFDSVEKLSGGGVGMIDHVHRGVDNLGQVVRRDVGGHADGDSRGAVDKQIGELSGENDGLFTGAVIIGPRVHGPLPQLGHEPLGQGRELGLGVPISGRGIA